MDGWIVNTASIPCICSGAGEGHFRKNERSFRFICYVVGNLTMRSPSRINIVFLGPTCSVQMDLSIRSFDRRAAPHMVTWIRNGHSYKLPVTGEGCRLSTVFLQETGIFPQVFLRGCMPFSYPGDTGKYALF